MKFHNTKIYELEESIKASNYPKRTSLINYEEDVSESDIKRGKVLGTTKSGSGHDCFLKGILVATDITAPTYLWLHYLRYHFSDIVSSQSKMHCITKMNIDDQCNKWVLHETKVLAQKLIYKYVNWGNVKWQRCLDGKVHSKESFFHVLISNLPQGLELTARVTTNYLQLKSMYNQRKNHKMQDWSIDFRGWCEHDLPKFMELTNKILDDSKKDK